MSAGVRMDPVTLVVVPGFLGGVVLAMIFVRLQRRSLNRSDPFRRDSPTDVINMARIRVAGVGGLGLVAMAVVVAVAVPRIGQSLAAGLVLGALCAVVLIARRYRTGGMPSSSQQIGANTTLAIDAEEPAAGEADRDLAPKARAVTPAST
jgi:hypothetical protein